MRGKNTSEQSEQGARGARGGRGVRGARNTRSTRSISGEKKTIDEDKIIGNFYKKKNFFFIIS